MVKITELSHELLAKTKNAKIAIDMTCGNGQDTVFLAKISEKVYAFDIQEVAINNTKKLLDDNKIDNVIVKKESHDLFDIFINTPFDIAIYNLGYLPGGDKKIKTEAITVVKSLEKAIYLLAENGRIIIVIYLHDKLESESIEAFVSSLGSEFDVMKYKILNKKKSPYIIEIHRVKKQEIMS